VKWRARAEGRSTTGKEPVIKRVPKMSGQNLGVNSPEKRRQKFYNNVCSQTRVFRGSPQQRVVPVFQIFIYVDTSKQ
jgi:hypothetical protein